MPRLRSRPSLFAFVLVMSVAAFMRFWLLADEQRVSFDSDEAIVGLMARHINQGKPIPTFFYGQAYMSSLDALLVAGGFRLLGESVTAMRAVQVGLTLVTLVLIYRLARTLGGGQRVALLTALWLAIPTPLAALYTTAALGGYNEVVLFGVLVLWWSWQIVIERRAASWRWAALGLAAGLGWWTHGAIVTACLVATALGLHTLTWHPRPWRGYALLVLAFFVGSAPWWVYNLRHDWEAMTFLISGFRPQPDVKPVTLAEASVGLLLLGLPALYGLRLPWEAGLTMSAGGMVAALIYLVLLIEALASTLARKRPCPPPERDRQARRWVWGVFAAFALIFIASPFTDATGRYLLPLMAPAALGVALGIERVRVRSRIVAAGLLAVLLTAQVSLVIRAAQTGTGLTAQLVENLRTPARYDTAMLTFLDQEGYTHGYAAYWTSFRLIFRSRERLILDTALPYDEHGYRPSNNRYAPYRAQVAAATRVVWITQNFPALDTLVAARLAEAGVTFRTRDFGPYRVYYDFSRRVSPAQFGLDAQHPLGTQMEQTKQKGDG